MNPSANPSNNSIFSSFGSSPTKVDSTDIFGSGSVSTSTSISGLGSSSTSVGGFFSSISWTTWAIIILILAFLGFNIFIYLAKGTQIFAQLSAYLAGIIGTGAAEATKEVTNVAATGTKAAADIASGTVNTTVNIAQDTASTIKNANYSQQQQLNMSLNQANKEQQQGEGEEGEPGYKADESGSSIQSSKSSGKAGWCYIGEDRGFRSCIQVGENDQCMSGDIFPSQEICMYPELRP